jgi:pilus assembly protein FimV
LISKSHRWQKTAIAAAAIALLGFTSTGASALSLGRLTVLSALGEPLRAEIDVPEINAEEAASLRASVASPATFVAAGLDYNPAMSGLQTSLQRRADGRAYIRLTSDRSINDPFVDMILEATWSSGRIVRDYTMLFDPPVLKRRFLHSRPYRCQPK